MFQQLCRLFSTLVHYLVQHCYFAVLCLLYVTLRQFIFFVTLPRLFNAKFTESNIKVIQIRGFN